MKCFVLIVSFRKKQIRESVCNCAMCVATLNAMDMFIYFILKFILTWTYERICILFFFLFIDLLVRVYLCVYVLRDDATYTQSRKGIWWWYFIKSTRAQYISFFFNSHCIVLSSYMCTYSYIYIIHTYIYSARILLSKALYNKNKPAAINKHKIINILVYL